MRRDIYELRALAALKTGLALGPGCEICGSHRKGASGNLCPRCQEVAAKPTPLQQVLGSVGWTADEFSELTGIPRMTVMRALRGQRVSRRTAERLSKITKHPPEAFRPETSNDG